jgi:hypothetical protein
MEDLPDGLNDMPKFKMFVRFSQRETELETRAHNLIRVGGHDSERLGEKTGTHEMNRARLRHRKISYNLQHLLVRHELTERRENTHGSNEEDETNKYVWK